MALRVGSFVSSQFVVCVWPEGGVCGDEEEGVEVGLPLCLVGLFVFLFLLSSSI